MIFMIDPEQHAGSIIWSAHNTRPIVFAFFGHDFWRRSLVRQTRNNSKLQSIQIADIDIALDMLRRYVNAPDIRALLSSLETLRTDPRNEAHQEQVTQAFNNLGPLQGAALTYAPYLHIFVSDDPFDD